jgi:hypothetical protein
VIHGDVLPVLLQVAAIALVTRMSRRAVLLAAVLCALAAMAKFTAVWAPIAIGLWLAFRARRRLALFAAAYAGSVVVMLALLEVASDGRLSENLAEVFVPGGSASEGSFSAGVATFLELVVARAGATWLLLPIAVLALLRAVARRSWTLVEIAFAAALVIVVVVLGNPGSDFNHLIDVSVLVVLVVGEQWARAARRPGPVSIVLPLIAVAVILGVAQSCRITMKAEVAHAVRVLRGVEANVYTTDPLAGVVRPEESLLTEDPTLSVIRGERPVLLDGIGLRRLGEQHPELVSDLERRLDRRAFDKVVLINSLEDRGWYETISMGARVRDAIARNYVLFSRVPAPPQRLYWVYAPRAPRKSTGT